MGSHTNKDGQFQSDKYPSCPPGKFPLSFTDVKAQPLIWWYSEITQDEELANDLKKCLLAVGYEVPEQRTAEQQRWDLLAIALGYNELARRDSDFQTKVWFRLQRELVLVEYARLGGEMNINNSGEFLDLAPGVAPGRPLFKKTEIEDIRKFLADHDAEIAEGGE